jgi:hypothetical protein
MVKIEINLISILSKTYFNNSKNYLGWVLNFKLGCLYNHTRTLY